MGVGPATKRVQREVFFDFLLGEPKDGVIRTIKDFEESEIEELERKANELFGQKAGG
jgi:hypothetical protein